MEQAPSEEHRKTAPAAPFSGAGTIVVTPTFNERDNLASFVSELQESLPDAHLLIVDDASPDGTGEIADQLHHVDPTRIHCLHRPRKLGLGTAYVDGFGWALERGYDLIGQMDADRSHDARDLRRLHAALRGGAGVALGSRNVPGGGVLGWGLGRHILSKGGSIYARTVLSVGVRDMTTGFKLWRREALVTIEPSTIHSNGYAFQIETTHRALLAGLGVVEVPIVFLDRQVGRSKMSRGVFAEAVLDVWRLRLRR